MVNVMIVEDQKLVRSILESYIKKEEGYELLSSIPGADKSPVNSRKKRYSQLRPGIGRDSSFSRFSPWTAKMVRISWREPLWWGR